jgi:hypothetical protein
MVCKNCNTQLNHSQKFCSECGAKIIKNRLTPIVLVEQLNEEVLSIDNKLFSTFIDLFRKPEAVISGYISGTRKKYINVIQYFTIALSLAGLQLFLMGTLFKDSIDIDMSLLLKSLENSPGQENNPFKDINLDAFNNYQSLFYIITIPISALATWLAYFVVNDRRYNFTEHLIFNIYYSAQLIIVSAILNMLFLVFGMNYLVISSFVTLFSLIYLFYALKRVFTDTLWNTLLKFILVMLVMSLLFFILIILFAIIIVIYPSIIK